jgi:hypothetical protein
MVDDTEPGYEFVAMQPSHAYAVGALHARYIENSQLANFGPELLGPLYEALITSAYGVGYVLLRDIEVVGFSFGRAAMKPTITQAIVRSWRRLFWPLFRFACRDPLAVPRLIMRFGQTGHVERSEGIGELLTIVIAAGVRGGQPSVRIAELLFARLRREGCHKVRWETVADNHRAQRYYAKIGGEIIHEDIVAGDRVFWYERVLEAGAAAGGAQRGDGS